MQKIKIEEIKETSTNEKTLVEYAENDIKGIFDNRRFGSILLKK